jgi:hypothetical protein
MTDLVERLRTFEEGDYLKLMCDAADEIERLRVMLYDRDATLVMERDAADNEIERLRAMLDRSNAAITRRDEGKSFQ